jgi:hypothetical protein
MGFVGRVARGSNATKLQEGFIVMMAAYDLADFGE